jgi:hypothetical protein
MILCAGGAIDRVSLQNDFPTQFCSADFWESLGRTVATFGLLEDVLCRAIFAFTATRPYSDTEISAAYEKWLPELQRALSDQLFALIDKYGKSVRDHPKGDIRNLTELLDEMKAASRIRNVLCHSSWSKPDENGASLPSFVNKQNEVFETPIDRAWLEQCRQHVVTLICAVVNSVTQLGWQFPGTTGPGAPIWNSGKA